MIEKVLITDTNVINAITRQLNIKNIRNEMFPTWRLTLQPGEEYDLGTAYYGAYLVRNSDSGAAALIMVGAGVSSNILLSDGNSISTDFTAGGKIILNKKTSNGNVYVKNGRSTEAYINVMQRLCKLNCVMLYSHSISSVGERPAPRGGTTRPDECKITTI